MGEREREKKGKERGKKSWRLYYVWRESAERDCECTMCAFVGLCACVCVFASVHLTDEKENV